MLRTIYLQLGALVLASLLAGLFFGLRGAVSAALGGGAYVLPSMLFALRLHLGAVSGKAANPVVLLGGELIKLAVTVGLLALVMALYRDVHWLALLIGLILTLKANLFAFMVKT